MPVAVIGPAGASLPDRRQLSLASARNLSWLKFASTCSGVPSAPDFTSRMISRIGGSKRFSWPTAARRRLLHRGDGAQHVGARHGQRLLAEHVLARLRGGDDLVGVLRVRRAQHHALHLRVRQHLLEARREGQLALAREGFRPAGSRPRRARRAACRCSRQVHDDAAPPTEADDGDVQHLLALPCTQCLVCRGESPPSRTRLEHRCPARPRRRRMSAAASAPTPSA